MHYSNVKYIAVLAEELSQISIISDGVLALFENCTDGVSNANKTPYQSSKIKKDIFNLYSLNVHKQH